VKTNTFLNKNKLAVLCKEIALYLMKVTEEIMALWLGNVKRYGEFSI
jgi:hypothetical protein